MHAAASTATVSIPPSLPLSKSLRYSTYIHTDTIVTNSQVVNSSQPTYNAVGS